MRAQNLITKTKQNNNKIYKKYNSWNIQMKYSNCTIILFKKKLSLLRFLTVFRILFVKPDLFCIGSFCYHKNILLFKYIILV